MIKFTHKKQIMRIILKYLNVKEGDTIEQKIVYIFFFNILCLYAIC